MESSMAQAPSSTPPPPQAQPPPQPPPSSPSKPHLPHTPAETFIAQSKFKRYLTIPATEAHGDLRVSYAVGGIDSDDAPTLLFIGGLLGGRFLATVFNYVCARRGMRIVVVDRPGIGSSTPVPPSLRLPVWLETVPVLMRELKTTHISLAAHSAGVIYALNTLYIMPWILPPQNRKLYLLAPWVPPGHSGVSYLAVASHIPSPLFNGFDSIVRFVNGTVVPTVQFSGVVSTAASAPFSKISRDTTTDAGETTRFQKHERDDLCREYCGVSASESVARSKALRECMFSESIEGGNHEALLVLRKEVAGSWGACENYDRYGEEVEGKLRECYCRDEHDGEMEDGRRSALVSAMTAGSKAPASNQQHRFMIKVFWAEKDGMIGKKGEEYFDKCFQRFNRDDGQASSGEYVSRLLYESEVVPDTDHDTLCLPQYGVMSNILEDISKEFDK